MKEIINLTSSNDVKFRFTIDRKEGTMNIKVGVKPPMRDKHIIAMEENVVEDIDLDTGEGICEAIGSTIIEWHDCYPEDILPEEDCDEYVDWED